MEMINFCRKFNLDSMDVRNVCVRRGWCTRMDNEKYSKMLKSISEANFMDDVNDSFIFGIAKDIFAYSENEFDTDTDFMCEILYELYKIAVISFEYID